MKAMLYRNLLLSKRMLWLTPVYTLIYLYMFKNPLSVIASSFFVASYMFLLTVFAYEEQAKATAFNKALPVKIGTVVAGYYVTMLLVLLYMLVWVMLILKVYASFVPTVPTVGLSDIVMSLAMVLVIASVQLPIIIRFGAAKTRIINLIILMVFIGALFFVTAVIDSLVVGMGANINLLCGGMLLTASLIYTLSGVISTGIYRRKESD